MKPKVLFIDWDGTLSNSKFWENCINPDIDQRSILEFKSFLFEESKEVVVSWMRGDISTADVMSLGADRFGLNKSILCKELENSCRTMKFISPDIPKQIKKIQQKGIKVVIATDNMDTFNNWTVPSLSLEEIFDDIVDSPSRRALKADFNDGHSPFFEPYLRELNIKAKDCVLVDNSLNNSVLKSIGMGFVHVNEESTLHSVLETYAN
jgi:FMN phosphatase YigB (HAD superfamily)